MSEGQNFEQYILDRQESAEKEDYITARLIAFNEAYTTAYPVEPCEPAPLHLYILDRAGTIRGGLVGRTHSIPRWLEVSIIWVDESVRQQGLGRWLMREAEAEAFQRGCRYARVATSNYQAPEFYRRLGYALYGQLENCAPGETTYYFCKELH